MVAKMHFNKRRKRGALKKFGLPFFLIFILGLVFWGDKLSLILDEPVSTNIDLNNKVVAEDNFESISFIKRHFLSLGETLSSLKYLSNLADPRVKYVHIYPGMRREEVALEFKKRLSWDEGDRLAFLSASIDKEGRSLEGRYYPGVYIIPSYKEGQEVGLLMLERFDREVMNKVSSSTKEILNMDMVVNIASIIEREAAGKHDMRLISGIIWNRIWNGMTLDIDSTLQYAKGSEENGWWPKVVPSDKYIESPYNTYQNEGLPPTAISSPSFAAVEAAIRPKKTSCLFFIHDKKRRIHCAKTYKEHKVNIERYLR